MTWPQKRFPWRLLRTWLRSCLGNSLCRFETLLFSMVIRRLPSLCFLNTCEGRRQRRCSRWKRWWHLLYQYLDNQQPKTGSTTRQTLLCFSIKSSSSNFFWAYWIPPIESLWRPIYSVDRIFESGSVAKARNNEICEPVNPWTVASYPYSFYYLHEKKVHQAPGYDYRKGNVGE